MAQQQQQVQFASTTKQVEILEQLELLEPELESLLPCSPNNQDPGPSSSKVQLDVSLKTLVQLVVNAQLVLGVKGRRRGQPEDQRDQGNINQGFILLLRWWWYKMAAWSRLLLHKCDFFRFLFEQQQQQKMMKKHELNESGVIIVKDEEEEGQDHARVSGRSRIIK